MTQEIGGDDEDTAGDDALDPLHHNLWYCMACGHIYKGEKIDPCGGDPTNHRQRSDSACGEDL